VFASIYFIWPQTGDEKKSPELEAAAISFISFASTNYSLLVFKKKKNFIKNDCRMTATEKKESSVHKKCAIIQVQTG
jgi:hypothetical protein